MEALQPTWHNYIQTHLYVSQSFFYAKSQILSFVTYCFQKWVLILCINFAHENLSAIADVLAKTSMKRLIRDNDRQSVSNNTQSQPTCFAIDKPTSTESVVFNAFYSLCAL